MAEISYEDNTLAKITVEGRIVDSETGVWVLLDLPAQDPIRVYLGEWVTVEVVAPPEWPPIEGDVWVDPKENPYLYDHYRGELRDGEGSTELPMHVLKAVGQLRLVHRKPADGGDR